MATQALSMTGCHAENWRMEYGEPPVVLNPAATLHACIAWAWGEVYEAHRLATMGMAADTPNVDTLFEVIFNRLDGAKRMMDVLGDLTCDDPRTLADMRCPAQHRRV